MRTAFFAVALLVLTGCAQLQFVNDHTRAAEISWQTLAALDTMQTVTIARSPDCLYEKSPLARMVYGTEHPSVGRVLMTNSAMGLLHWGAGSALDRHAEGALADASNDSAALWRIARFSYYAVSFMGSGTAVAGNVRLGIKPLSRARCGS